MAGIMERMGMLIKSNANALIDKMENPTVIINQTIADAQAELAKMKREASTVLANESQAKARLDSLTKDADKWHGIAKKALAAGNEGDARTALSKEQELRDAIGTQEAVYASAKQASDKLRGRIKEVEDGIRQMQNKAAEIKAKEATAKATAAASAVSSKGYTSGSKAFDTFNRMEQKADQRLAEAESLAELSTDHAAAEAEDLFKKYTSGTGAVDDALASLRAELGMDGDAGEGVDALYE